MASNFFESYKSAHEVEGPSDRNFGFTVGGILLAIAAIRTVFSGEIGTLSTVLIVIGGALVVAACFRPPILSPLNKAWMKLGLLLFRVVNPIVMFLIFAITVVPTGLVMRLRGKDLLNLKTDPDRQSYWIERPQGEPGPEGMINQF